MATKTDIASLVENKTEQVLLFTRDLREMHDEWETLADGERASLGLEWAHLMADYLTVVEEHYAAGALDEHQGRRYQELKGELKEALPIIQALNFYRPPVSLE